MPSKREKRLPSSSSTLKFVDNKKEKAWSKRCFMRSFIALGLSLAAIAAIVVVIVVWFPTSSRSEKPAENNHERQCSFSDEARRIGLEQFLKKLQSEFYTYHPYLIATKPGVTTLEVRKIYHPYDFRPEAIKNATDAGAVLYNELQTTVFADVNDRKLRLRERKAMYVAKNILRVAFGWSPYEENYYSGGWMLGPNFFCWQPVCYLLTNLEMSLPHFKPGSVSDIKVLHVLLREHNNSVYQYKENLRLAIKVGMVRSVEACKVGVREFEKKFLSIAISNETGILETQVAKILLSKEFLDELTPDVREAWTQQTGQSVEDYLKHSLIQNLGRPLHNLIRFLETEYMRHCVPNNASSGLSSLPLPHVYVNGVVKSDQPTTQKLPSGHKLNGTQAYLKLISIFTNLDFSPKQLRDIAQERLDVLMSQVVSVARLYTLEKDNSTAVSEFRRVLESRDMFFNAQPFPANESGEAAFFRCTTEQASRLFCPTRWRAMQTWIKTTTKTMNLIRPKLSKLFYDSGPKKTIPKCAITVVPWFHSEAVFHSYSESKSVSCAAPSLQMLPFFVDNFGPKYTEWTTTAHEQLPGHHLEVRSYMETFLSKCNDVISWLSGPNYFPGFTEGWATYVENPVMSDDTDIYDNKTDKKVLLQKYGMLKYQILAALRTLLDVNINYYNMSRMEAELIYNKYAWGSSARASKDITRFQSSPGAVTSYMIGQMTFVQARRLMLESLGPKFSLPEFHYQVLRQGEIPLEYLLRYIRDLSDL
ncbi:hypothetical protein ACROYT_G032580 [Oculina patagonica]